MKKLFVCSLALGLASGLAGLAFSQTLGIEAHGLYVFDFQGDLASYKLEPKDGGGGGLAFVVAATPYLKFDFGIDYFSANLKDSDFTGVKGGHIDMLPLTLGFRAGPSLDFAFLYAGAGIGRSFNNWSGGTGDGWVTLKDSMIYYACLGAEIFLTDILVLRPELRYNWLKPELKGDPIVPWGETSWKEDWDLSHFQGRFGLGIYF